MFRVIAILLSLTLFGCATQKGDRMDTEVQLWNYNSISKSYYAEKTYLLYFDDSKNPYLSYRAEASRYNEYFNLNVAKEKVPQLIAILDKYMEWDAIATRDKDMINIEIQKDVVLQERDYSYTFSIVSYSTTSHVLKMERCTREFYVSQRCDYSHPIMYIGTGDAVKLKKELLKFSAGGFKSINYNKYQ